MNLRATGFALLPLRLFLGATFVYAGVQKLSDPGYLHRGAPTYIGTQLHGFATGTPGGFILRAFALPHPVFAGVAVALLEIVVGLLVFAGLATRGAAAVGLLLNLLLFLTNSWKTYPYFLGPDIVFVFAWLPFVLVGAREQPALDHELSQIGTWRRARVAHRGEHSGAGAAAAAVPVTRRALLAQAVGATTLVAAAIGGLAALARGSYRPGRTLAAAQPAPASAAAPSATGTQTTPSPSTGGASRGAGPTSASPPPGAVRLGPATALPRGQGATYADPADGSPDIVIRNGDGSLVAFSAVCTHAGCTVGYQGGQIVCPCHGGSFNARTGAVEGGPPPTPLARKRVVERGGQLYAVPS